jgi:hypothetical protein
MVCLVWMTINSKQTNSNSITIRQRREWELDALRTTKPIFTMTLASRRVASLKSMSMTSLNRTELIKSSGNFLITTNIGHAMMSQGERLNTSYIREILYPGKMNVKALYHARMHSYSSQKDFLMSKTRIGFTVGPNNSFYWP